MLRFQYSGRTKEGKLISGDVEAKTKEEALSLLVKRGIAVTRITPAEDNSDAMRKIEQLLGMNKPTVTDLILFCRQMYSLSKSGVPIISAIKAVSGNAKNPHLVSALETIVEGLENGRSLHSCMSDFDKIFPPVMLALVGVGESTGNLDTVFAQLSTHFERESTTTKQVSSAMRYPIFVMVAIGIAVMIVNVMVIPAFAGFFDKFGSELPLPTKILIGISDFTVNNGGFLILGIVILITWWVSFLKTKTGQLFWDRKKLNLPIIGAIFVKALLSRFARSFALASKAGVPLLDAITLVAKTSGNAYVNLKILGMKDCIERGESLTMAADKSKLFTSLVMQMLHIGEQTGEIDRLLEEVADFYDEELDYELSRLSASIEPILISVIAAMVLVLALGIFLPMWDISSAAAQ